MKVIKANAYTPNALARSLLHNRTLSIGVLTVDILNPYYATVVHSIERNLSAYGYSILLCNTGGNYQEKAKYIRTLLEKRVDGLVFVGSVYQEKDGSNEILAASHVIPIIMINSIIEAENIYCILCDDRKGIRVALNYLLDAGRSRILFINSATTTSALLKEDEFRKYMVSHAITEEMFHIIETSTDCLQDLPKFIAEAFSKHAYEAILASDDLFANVAVNTLHNLHLPIPDSVWVIGYNNSYISDQTFPRLSSIDSRIMDIGVKTAEILVDILSNNTIHQRIQYLSPELVIKESSGTALH